MLYIVFLLFCIVFVALTMEPRPERAIPVGIFSAVIFTYGLVLLDKLSLQPYFMIGIMAVGCITLFVLKQKGKWMKVCLIDWAYVGVILLGVISILIICFKDYLVLAGGSYNYYASVVKYMYLEDSLIGAEVALQGFSYYEPSIGIWHYFINKCFGSYEDWHLFFSYGLLLYICFLPILGGFTKSEKIWGGGLSVIIYFLFPIALAGNTLFLHLAVDMAVGSVFAFMLYYVLERKNENTSNIGFACGVLVGTIMLGLSKSAALLFAVVCLLVYVVRTVGTCEKQQKIQCFILSTLTAIISLLGILSWKVFCKKIAHYPRGMFEGGEDKSLVFPAYTKETVVNYIRMLFTEPINAYRGLTIAGVFLLCVVVIGYLIFKNTKFIRNLKICISIIMVGFFVFCLGHIYTYLFNFSEAETKVMSSYARYLLMYMVPVEFLLAMMIEKYRILWAKCVFIMLIVLSIPFSVILHTENNPIYELKKEYTDVYREASRIADFVDETLNQEEQICILYSENVHWLLPGATKYKLIPIKYDAYQSVTEQQAFDTAQVYQVCYYIEYEEEKTTISASRIYPGGDRLYWK